MVMLRIAQMKSGRWPLLDSIEGRSATIHVPRYSRYGNCAHLRSNLVVGSTYDGEASIRSHEKQAEEAEPAEDRTEGAVARGAGVVADGVRDARQDPGGRDGGGETREEEAVEEGEEGEAGQVLQRVLVNALGAVEEVGVPVLFCDGLFGVQIRIRNLGGLAGTADLDTHEEGHPDGGDDARNNVALPNGEEESLHRGRLRRQEVVERRNRRGERGQGDALRHGCNEDSREKQNGWKGRSICTAGLGSRKVDVEDYRIRR